MIGKRVSLIAGWTVFRSKILLCALAVGSTLAFSPLVSGLTIPPLCPISMPQVPWSVVWVDLKSVPTDIPMDLVSFYDRASGFQFLVWAGLFIFALAGISLVVERASYYSRASRETKLFLSAANDALIHQQPVDALRLASVFPSSPVAWVVDACLTSDYGGKVRFSPARRHMAATAKTVDVGRGLAMLSAIAMTTPIIGAGVLIEGLIRCFRAASISPISSDVLHNWVADWLLTLLAALALGFAATWAHRLLSAKANRIILEMDRLSLAMISLITDPAERPLAVPLPITPPTSEIKMFVTGHLGD